MRQILAAFALLLLVSTACSINPVSGRPEFVLRSTASEIRLGAEGSQMVADQIGLYDGTALAGYVSEIGARIAEHSPRQNVPYSFGVVDMVPPNAFALPGGPVYVSRGLIVLVNSEDELANVLGHEVAHIAARHHIRREAWGVPLIPVRLVTGIAGAITGIISPRAGRGIVSVGQAPGAFVSAPYGRRQEHQADQVGQEIAAAAGWDPNALSSFLSTLSREEKLAGRDPDRRDFLSSHPTSPDRAERTARHAAQLVVAERAPIARDRADFLSRLNGLLVGLSAAEGVFQENRFLHGDLGFRLVFPEGWKTLNGRHAVLAVDEEGKALVVLQASEGPLLETAENVVRENGMRLRGELESIRIGELSAVRAVGTHRGAGVMVTWIEHGKLIYQVSGFCEDNQLDARLPTFDAVAQSFRSLTSAERSSITELRIRIAKARAGESLSAFAARTKTPWTADELAVANGVSVGQPLRAGQLLKIVSVVPYRPTGGAD